MIKIKSDEIGAFMGDYFCSLVDFILYKFGSSLYTIPKDVATNRDTNAHYCKLVRDWLTEFYRLDLEDAPVLFDKELPFLELNMSCITESCIDIKQKSVTGKTGILIKFNYEGFSNHTEERYKAEALFYLKNHESLEQVLICRAGIPTSGLQDFIPRWTLIKRDDLEPVDELRNIIKHTYEHHIGNIEHLSLSEKEKNTLALQKEINNEQNTNRVKAFQLLGTKIAIIPHELYEQLTEKRKEMQTVEAQLEELKDKIMSYGDIECVMFTDKGKKIANIFTKRFYNFEESKFKRDYPSVYNRYFKPCETVTIWFEDWRGFI